MRQRFWKEGWVSVAGYCLITDSSGRLWRVNKTTNSWIERPLSGNLYGIKRHLLLPKARYPNYVTYISDIVAVRINKLVKLTLHFVLEICVNIMVQLRDCLSRLFIFIIFVSTSLLAYNTSINLNKVQENTSVIDVNKEKPDIYVKP